jgi:hypothetical protein
LDEKVAAAEEAEVVRQKELEAVQAEFNVATESMRAAQSEAAAAQQACNEKVERLNMELAELRSAHESKHASTQSYNQQQLLNMRGQLDALEHEKQLAASRAEEQRRTSNAALAELQAEKTAMLEHHQAQAKQLADNVLRAEAALAEAQESAAASAKRASELDAVIESLMAQALKARSNADTFASRKSELETRIRSLEGQLQEARSRATEMTQRSVDVAAQLESLKQNQAATRAATCPTNPAKVAVASSAQMRAPAPAPVAVRTSIPEALSGPKLMAQQLDHSKLRRRSSSSASKRSVGKPVQTSASITSNQPASEPDIATAQASVAYQNVTAPSVQAQDKAPDSGAEDFRPKIYQSASLTTGSKASTSLPAANSQPAPLPNASSGRRLGATSKKKVQRVNSAHRPSDIFDFD